MRFAFYASVAMIVVPLLALLIIVPIAIRSYTTMLGSIV